MQAALILGIFLILAGWWSQAPIMATLGWLLLLLVILNRLWFGRALKMTKMRRTAPDRVFFGDEAEVEISINNAGRLPMPWISVQDIVPSGLEATPTPNWVISLRSREKMKLNYKLNCRRRGRYRIGPLEGNAGVVLDNRNTPKGNKVTWSVQSKLTVYPNIVPLEHLQLPSRLPLGNIRTRQPLQPDNSRFASIREYQSGDDPRHIDWRNTARMGGVIQVKEFERTRFVPLAILLDLRMDKYEFSLNRAVETSITVAASLASRANDLNQPVGMFSNGYDPGWSAIINGFGMTPLPFSLPQLQPRTGVGRLYEILDILAGLQPTNWTPPLEQIVGKWMSNLPAGATIAIISYFPYPGLITEASRLRRAGFTPICIFTGVTNQQSGIAALQSARIPVFDITYAGELNLAS